MITLFNDKKVLSKYVRCVLFCVFGDYIEKLLKNHLIFANTRNAIFAVICEARVKGKH